MSGDPDARTLPDGHVCQKHGIRMDAVRLRCRDPKTYCKFRQACAVDFLTRRRRGLDDDEPNGAAPATDVPEGEERASEEGEVRE